MQYNTIQRLTNVGSNDRIRRTTGSRWFNVDVRTAVFVHYTYNRLHVSQ